MRNINDKFLGIMKVRRQLGSSMVNQEIYASVSFGHITDSGVDNVDIYAIIDGKIYSIDVCNSTHFVISSKEENDTFKLKIDYSNEIHVKIRQMIIYQNIFKIGLFGKDPLNKDYCKYGYMTIEQNSYIIHLPISGIRSLVASIRIPANIYNRKEVFELKDMQISISRNNPDNLNITECAVIHNLLHKIPAYIYNMYNEVFSGVDRIYYSKYDITENIAIDKNDIEVISFKQIPKGNNPKFTEFAYMSKSMIVSLFDKKVLDWYNDLDKGEYEIPSKYIDSLLNKNFDFFVLV